MNEHLNSDQLIVIMNKTVSDVFKMRTFFLQIIADAATTTEFPNADGWTSRTKLSE
jgi:hypothetical protein